MPGLVFNWGGVRPLRLVSSDAGIQRYAWASVDGSERLDVEVRYLELNRTKTLTGRMAVRASLKIVQTVHATPTMPSFARKAAMSIDFEHGDPLNVIGDFIQAFSPSLNDDAFLLELVSGIPSA